jgi:hypothetical protein
MGLPSAADAATRARLAAHPAVAVVVAVQDVRTPATPLVALSASAVHRADVRPTGRVDVRCPRVRCDLGVRTDTRPVSAAAAAALSAPRWILKAPVRPGPATSGAAGSTGRGGR